MTTVLIGIAMVFVIEGLVLALAPSYYEKVVAMLADVPIEQRRVMGLVGASIGVFSLWFLV